MIFVTVFIDFVGVLMFFWYYQNLGGFALRLKKKLSYNSAIRKVVFMPKLDEAKEILGLLKFWLGIYSGIFFLKSS